ncbi:MAG: hypothetical protein ACFBSE_18195 [Prochloraceae cyanobacterium]
MITKLSSEQEELLLKYQRQWEVIATQTKLIDRELAEQTIKAAYKIINYREPEIIFVGSPFAAIKKIIGIENYKSYLGCDISDLFYKRVIQDNFDIIGRHLDRSLFNKLIDRSRSFPREIESSMERQLLCDCDRSEIEDSDLSELLEALIRPAGRSDSAFLLDFCISVLRLQHDGKKWQLNRELMHNCDFIFIFENVCIVCDRPCKLSFDRQNILHAEWEYAAKYADGYGVYAYHGGERPEGRRCHDEEYIEPGTKVKLLDTEEYGIVTHCWYSDELCAYDCYIAFYGTSFPDRDTYCRPYILRYFTTSLEILE